MNRPLSAAAALLGLVTLTSCGSAAGGESGDGTTLDVLAASSLTESFGTLAEDFEADNPGVTVRLSFGSSSALAQQVTEGAPADVLATADLAATPGWEHGEAAAEKRLLKDGEHLSEEQERLFADGRSGGTRSVLLVLQGMDTSGKGGIVRHVLGMVDPQGVQLRSFGVPTEKERSQHYLQRIREALPAPGRIGTP